jgi:hypothetical protein
VSQTFVDITSANFSSAAKIGWVRTEFFRLMRFASGGQIGTSFWTTVSFGALFDTTVTDAWKTFVVVLVPSVTRVFKVTKVINTLSATVIVWDTLFNFATATGIDQSSGMTSWARHIVVSWAVTGASTVFDLFQTFKSFSSFFVKVFVSFSSGNDASVLARADWIGNSNHFWTDWIDMRIAVTFSVVTAFMAFSIGWVQDGQVWFAGWARDWSWEAETESAQSVWITDFWPFRNGVIRQAFKNGATIGGVPDFIDLFWLTIVHAFFAFSSHAAFTLDKKWGGTIFTQGIIEWVTKFWGTLALVLVAAFVNSFRDRFVEDWTGWDFWSGAVFAFDLNDFPQLTAVRSSVFDDFMSFFVKFGWLWSAEFPSVVASS